VDDPSLRESDSRSVIVHLPLTFHSRSELGGRERLRLRASYPLPWGRARWSPTARVQRRSSETARCTSTGDRL